MSFSFLRWGKQSGSLLRFLLCALAFCCFTDFARAIDIPNSSPAALVCEYPVGTLEGVVLLVHGLNQNPNTMRQLREVLRSVNYITCQLRLSGHQAETSVPDVSYAQWHSEVLNARSRLSKNHPDLPQIGVGYSLGGALLVDSCDVPSLPCFSKLVLLAPAISLRQRSWIIRALTPLRFFGLSLPSLSPKPYRLRSATPLSFYRATFDTADAVRSSANSTGLRFTSVLLFLTSEDEMVDAEETEQYFQNSKTASLTSVWLKPKPKRSDSFNHLLIDEEVLGQAAWTELRNALVTFLDDHSQSR